MFKQNYEQIIGIEIIQTRAKLRKQKHIFLCIGFRDSPDSKINWKLGHIQKMHSSQKNLWRNKRFCKKAVSCLRISVFLFFKVLRVYNQNDRLKTKEF